MAIKFNVSEDGVLQPYNGTIPIWDIPDEINGIKVISISDKCFRAHSKVKKIIFPKYLKSIGKYAFEKCCHLEELDFTRCENLEVIDEGAFFKCKELKYFSVPDSLKTIEMKAFEGCTSLFEFKVFDNSKLEKIGAGTFHQSGLEKVFIIGNKETLYVYSQAFSKNLIEELIIEGNIEFDNSSTGGLFCNGYQFSDNKIKELDLSKTSIKKISFGAFENNCIRKLILPPYCTCICNRAFSDNKIKEVELPSFFTDKIDVEWGSPFDENVKIIYPD